MKFSPLDLQARGVLQKLNSDVPKVQLAYFIVIILMQLQRRRETVLQTNLLVCVEKLRSMIRAGHLPTCCTLTALLNFMQCHSWARAQEIQLACPVSHPLACSNSLYKVLTCVLKKMSTCGLGCTSVQLRYASRSII